MALKITDEDPRKNLKAKSTLKNPGLLHCISIKLSTVRCSPIAMYHSMLLLYTFATLKKWSFSLFQTEFINCANKEDLCLKQPFKKLHRCLQAFCLIKTKKLKKDPMTVKNWSASCYTHLWLPTISFMSRLCCNTKAEEKRYRIE